MMLLIDIMKSKYERNKQFRVNIKNKIVIRIAIILAETRNNDFE